MPATTARRDQQRRRREENRARIVAAAEDALRHKPFREVSIDEVMQAAGLTRTIFYRHFDDIADLLVKVAGSVFAELYELQVSVTAVEGADAAALRAVLEPAIEAFAEHAPLVRAIAEASSHDRAVERVYAAEYERFIVLTADALRRLRGPDLAHPDQTARALTFMNVGYLLDVFGREPKVSTAVALDTITEIWAAVLSR